MRANNTARKERRTLVLDGFKGVDFSSSPLRVHPNRASNMTNFIKECGKNKKRNGYEEIAHIMDTNGNSLPINGVFNYVNNDKNEIIVHAGKLFYRLDNDCEYTDITLSSTLLTAKCNISRLKNTKSQAFLYKERMYIIGCGDYLVYGSWDGENSELRRVENNVDTYIPTTTTSIDNDTVTADTVRQAIDAINVLSNKRKNTLVGVALTDAVNTVTWTLDTDAHGGEYKIDPGSDIKILVETMRDSTPTNLEISNSGIDKIQLYLGGVSVGSVDYKTAKITLKIPTPPIGENKANIVVTFQKTIENSADRINNCNFGIIFDDTLFLSGNKKFKNIDFHSDIHANDEKYLMPFDFTYFGADKTASFGSDAYAVKGYAKLADNTLAVFKEASEQESTIYYRNSIFQSGTDEKGNPYARYIYPITAGANGEGVISRHAMSSLGGDNLILSKNGVYGIVLSNNVATSERYAKERSRSINERLKKHNDLTKACGIAFENKYYLAIDNVCYVADARYRYRSEDDLDESFNYEWWFWDNIPATIWINIGGVLHFGCDDGRICKFDDKYSDRTHQNSNMGDISMDLASSSLICIKSIFNTLKENDIIELKGNNLFSIMSTPVRVLGNKIFVSTIEIEELFEGNEIYVDMVNSSGLRVNTKYFIHSVDKGESSCFLKNVLGEDVNLANGGFRMHRNISKQELYLAHVLDGRFKLKLFKESNKQLTLSNYNGNMPNSILARFTFKKNVSATWYTPIFDLGTSEYRKTLLKMTVCTEPKASGALSFGYETKNVDKEINAKGVKVFSFSEMDFENFSFDTGFANSYSIKIKERNFNFIIFRLVSDNDHDCGINSFVVTYKLNKNSQGVQ